MMHMLTHMVMCLSMQGSEYGSGIYDLYRTHINRQVRQLVLPDGEQGICITVIVTVIAPGVPRIMHCIHKGKA
jgi:hypothetical protein